MKVGGSTNVNQELKVLFKELKFNNSKTYENGGPQPSRVIGNERKLKEIGKNVCAPIGI